MSMTRRHFLYRGGLLIPASWMMPSVGAASFLLRRFQGNDRKFAGAFLSRFYPWHCREFFNFEKHLSDADKAFVRAATGDLRGFERKVGDGAIFPTFLVSHRFTAGKRNSSRLAMGTFAVGSHGYMAAITACQKRGIKLDGLGFNLATTPLGLAWDVERERFKVYADVENLASAASDGLEKKLASVAEADRFNAGVVSFVFKGAKLTEKRLHVRLRDGTLQKRAETRSIPLALKFGTGELVLSSVAETKARLEVPIFGPDYFSEAEADLVRDHQKEFSSGLDSISFQGAGANTLYFP